MVCFLPMVWFAAVASKCDTWYDTVGHGSSFRDVKDFGAKGDGLTDDTDAINNAISHSMSKVGNKGSAMIYFPSGDYVVSDTYVKGERRRRRRLALVGRSAARSHQYDSSTLTFTFL